MDKDLKQPLVTILMPVYNGEKFLKEAIESILCQTYELFEFLIIDDGSKDNTAKIIKEYKKADKRIMVITHNGNKGLVYSLNEGLKEAKGSYIARMDADDISFPNRLSEQVSFMNRNKDVTVCGTWANAIDEVGNPLFQMKSPTGFLLKYNYWKPSPMIHPSVMFRKSAIKNIIFSLEFPRAEDYELWLRFGKLGKKIKNIPKFLLGYRINTNGISRSNQKEQIISSLNAFNRTFNEKIAMHQFLSLSCLDFKLSCVTRFRLLWKLRKVIKYPLWFMLIDNLYYGIRRALYAINPNLNRYK